MQVTIFGANGKVGSIVTKLALEKGYNVTAFVHSTSKLSPHKNLTLKQGDIYDTDTVTEAVKGSNAIISTLGSWGTPKKDIVSTGMRNIIPAMEQGKIKRIITLTGSDSEAQGDSKDVIHRMLRPLLKLVAGKILRDGEAHIELLEASNLDWTIIRSPAMTNMGDPAKFLLGTKRPMSWRTVNRRSVARAIVELVEQDQWSQKAPYITRH